MGRYAVKDRKFRARSASADIRSLSRPTYASGMPGYETVGLPGASVRESKDRVRAAIRNAGLVYPQQRITINLAPADTKKHGPIYDLAIAAGLLAASGQISAPDSEKSVLLGELSLERSA